MKHRLIVPDEYIEQIRHSPPHLKSSIRHVLDEILETPSAGKPLTEELEGFRSYKIGKFRIIYQVKELTISIVAIGPRKTIYQKMSLELKRRSEEKS